MPKHIVKRENKPFKGMFVELDRAMQAFSKDGKTLEESLKKIEALDQKVQQLV